MSLYQTSVLRKFLAHQDETQIQVAFESFRKYFHDPEIQANIRNSKEEQFQEGFLRELFVKILDYTINPNPGFNLTTELKNIKGAKKTDGAILSDGNAIAVIELKGTDTKDLDKVTDQAFNYKNNQPECEYVITSNFEKLRFYIHNAVDHIEFNLFTISYDQFQLLWLFLQKDNLLGGTPLRIKSESLLQEEQVTKQLYKDYSNFKNDLWHDMCQRNPDHDELELYKKSQKLLDRFLFIFFAEDKGLLPPNSINVIVDDWKRLKDLDEYKPLYSRFLKYFGYMNEGYVGKRYEIHAYNGGLFKPDPLLDSLSISDEVLEKHSLKITEYDFDTEVDTNILGHIFEHSLNEIENVRAKLEGEEIDKSKTKRKKDGVFYTPKYITKYIVDNTVGRLCEEKKQEIGIYEAEFSKDRKGRKKDKLKELDEKLKAYRNWLLGLTICDPACGSGAFLNQALEFLIAEHRYIDELESQLLGYAMVFPDVENQILEGNLYGVDINEESVEIARLSLWLRTAKKGRKLTSLSDNLKVGNSLIDDPKVAGELAFHWQKEFPKVFENGGFDVIIGNPPYVRAELLGEFQEYLEKNYSLHNPSGDLFSYFYEKSFKLLKSNVGLFGFISNTFDKTTAGVSLREYLQKEVSFLKYIDFTEVQIFEGATTYPVIITAKNIQNDKNNFQFIKISKKSQSSVIDIDLHHSVAVEQLSLEKSNWSFKSKAAVELISKLKENRNVRELYGKCYYGVKTALNEAFIIPKSYEVSEHIKPIYEGKELSKWANYESVQQLILFKSKWTKKEYGEDVTEEIGIKKLTNDYPELLSHILPLEERAKKRYDKGDFFWELRNCAYYDLFEKPKVVFPNLQNGNKFSFDETGAYINAPAVILPTNDKFLTAILNSKLVWYFLTNICVVRSGGYIEVKPQYFEQIPIPTITNKEALEVKTNAIIDITSKMQKVSRSFTNYLQSQFTIEKLSKKLQNWHELEFGDFIKELNKAIKKAGVEKLSKMDEIEWMEVFETKKAEAQTLKAEIDKTDKEIDQMVYELYGLTNEEIEIVENSK